MEQEIWKDIPGYEGHYQASTLGRIRSTGKLIDGKRTKGKVLKPLVNTNNGYLYVSIGNKRASVHRLVAITFIPNPENKPCVGHKDTNRTNAHVDNLEWVTYSENNYNPITLAKNSETNRKRMSNTSVRKRISESVKARYRQDSEYATLVSEKTKLAMSRLEVKAKLSRRVEMLLNGEVVACFDSIKEASKATKHCTAAIAKWCNGFSKKKNPYEWRFA